MDTQSALEKQFLEPMKEELKSMFTVKWMSGKFSAALVVRNGFTLGMVVGFIMNQWVRFGYSFNKLEIDVSKLTVRLQVMEEAQCNKLTVVWKQT